METWFSLLLGLAQSAAPPNTDPTPPEPDTDGRTDADTFVVYSNEAEVAPEPDSTHASVPSTDDGEEATVAQDAVPKTWVVGGFVDTAYLINSNAPDNHLYRGTVTTPRTGEFTVNLIAAYLRHEPVHKEPWRLELGLQFGAATDALYAGEPVPGGADGRFGGPEVWKHIGLANAGGKIDRSGTEIGAGLFASPIGIGGFWSPPNWNYSPSWESNAAPFYLAGAQIIQDLRAGFGLQGWVVNGWQTVGDGNRAPSYLAGLTWNRAGERGTWNAAQFVYAGPDDVDLAPRAWRIHSDTQVMWEGARVGLGAVWDYGQERVTSAPADPVHMWTGGGLFFHGLAYDGRRVDVDLAARPDAWFDRDGRIYGVAQWLVSGTATANVRLFDALLTRVEYRFDHSTAADGFFYAGSATNDAGPGLASDQHTVFFSIAGYFEHAFAIVRPPT